VANWEGYSTGRDGLGSRGGCLTNRPLTTTANVAEGAPINVDILEEVRQKIRAELTRWNEHRYHDFTVTQPTPYTTSTIITDNHVEELYFMVDKVTGGQGFMADRDGELIDATDWAGPDIYARSIYEKYEIVRKDCICNSDCSCNSVCTCNNNCECNYTA